MKWVPENLPVVQRSGRETDHLPSSTEYGKNEWSYAATPLTRFLIEERHLQKKETVFDGKPTDNTNRTLGPLLVLLPLGPLPL